MPNCTLFGPKVSGGPHGRASAAGHILIDKVRRSAVRKLIALISKVLLDDGNRILNPQGIC